MLIRDYCESPASKALIVSDSFESLMRADDARSSDEVSLLAWRAGFRNDDLDSHLAHSSWAIEMLAAMPPSAEWPWRLCTADGATSDRDTIVRAVEAASGTRGSPCGNVHVTLELRAYRDRHNAVGNADWWRGKIREISSRNAFGKSWSKMLVTSLDEAGRAGSQLYTEQLSIILSKDGAAPIATLTPTLHADSFYARRETAIVSLLEKGWDEPGGAIFLPLRNMAELWDMRPITLEKLKKNLGNECIVVAGNGDVMIYDGMIGPDGLANPSRGIPHISPDRPGSLSRLCILMHHKRSGKKEGKSK